MIISPQRTSPFSLPLISGGQAPFSFGNALQFDGTDDYVSFSEIGDSLTSWSVSFWLNSENLNSAFQTIFDSGISEQTYIRVDSEFNRFVIRILLVNYLFTIQNLNNSEWIHFAVIVNSGNCRVFVNNIESSSGTKFIGALTGFRYLGFQSGIGNYLNGKLDEVAFWNTGLTTTQIGNLYNSGNGDFATNYSPANLIAYWRMNGTSGDSTAIDEQGSYNGTLNNFNTATCWVAH